MSGQLEAYCVDSGRPVVWEAGDRCVKHGARDNPCFAAQRPRRCTHPLGGSNGSTKCQECGYEISASDA